MSIEPIQAQLKRAYVMIKDGQKDQAMALLKPILAQTPDLMEGWWLAAHATTTTKDTLYACEKLLALRPDYQPAQQLRNEQLLKVAQELLDSKQKTPAFQTLKGVLDQEPKNAVAWWLMVEAAPSSVDAALACQKVLELQPGNVEARQRLEELQSHTASQISHKMKLKEAKPEPRKRSRLWMVSGLIGMIFLILVGGYAGIMLSGQTFGLPIGRMFDQDSDLGSLGNDPISRPASIISGATHTYHFYARANTQILVLINFFAPGKVDNSVTLIGPKGFPVAAPGVMMMGGKPVVQFQTYLPESGRYLIRIKGKAGEAQGAYLLNMAALPDMGNDGGMQLPSN